MRRQFLERLLAGVGAGLPLAQAMTSGQAEKTSIANFAALSAQGESHKESPFKFTATQVAQVLMPPDGRRRIEHIGSATSHFQAEPVLYDDQGRPLVASDWDFEVTRRLRGEHSCIPNADINNLPRFLHRKEQYLDRSAALAENTFRFSLDFARLCPAKGEFNDRLMSDYIKTLLLIKSRGQEPFLTLHHFTMPRYLIQTDRKGNIKTGGWEHPEVLQHFRYYVHNVIRCLTDERRVRSMLEPLDISTEARDAIVHDGLVRYFMTINEPACILFNGYLNGTMPPYKRGSLLASSRVLARLVEGHDIARDEIKRGLTSSHRQPQICIGHNWQYFDGIAGRLVHEVQAQWTDSFERNGTHSDFLGLHYYFRRTLPLTTSANRARDYTEQPTFGDVYPEGILKVARLLHAAYPQKNIFISEFGFSDSADRRRPFWILETLRYIIEATRTGIPITGILLWTLVNNFEWDLGMSQKFGLFSEAELTSGLMPREDRISSWEVWRTAARAITAPSPTAIEYLQRSYDRASAQYKAAGGKY